MNRFLLVLTILAIGFSPAFGLEVDDEAVLKQKDTNSLDFQKLVMEQNLATRIKAAIGPLFQEARYDLSVSINYKIYKGGRKTAKNTIELDKYGVVAPGVSQAELKTDLIANIGWINVKLIAYDHIPEDKVALFDDIAYRVVDMVDQWRVRVQVVNPPAPPTPVAPPPQPVVTVPVSYAFLGVAFLFSTMVFAYFFFKSRRYQGHAQYAKPQGYEAAPPPHVDPFHHAPSQAARPKYSADPFVVTPSAEMVDAEYSESSAAMPEAGPIPFVDETEKESTLPSENVTDVYELLAKCDPDAEKKIWDALVRSGQMDVLKEAAHRYYPAELVYTLNPAILSAALDLMPVDDRFALIVSTDPANSWVLINCLNEKARAYMEHELEKHKANSTVQLEIRRNAPRYRKTFIDHVRQVLTSNQEYTRLAQPQLDDWLQRKSGGVRDVG